MIYILEALGDGRALGDGCGSVQKLIRAYSEPHGTH